MFGFYERRSGFPDSGFAISGRGLLAWLLGLAVAGYIAAAGALTWWFRRQPHNRVGFAQVLAWPVQREEVRRLRGEMWLAQADEARKAGRTTEWYFLIRRGLAAAPDNLEARKTLVEFLLAVGQRPQARAVLEEAGRHGLPTRGWIDEMFAALESGEDWALELTLADAFLARARAPDAWMIRQHLLARKVTALRGLGRLDEALAVAEAAGDSVVFPLKQERLRTLLALGRSEEAARRAADWVKSAARSEGPGLLRMEARAWREAGRLEQMEQALEELVRRQGARADIHVFVLEQRVRAGVGGEKAIDEFLLHFGGSSAQVNAVAALLAELPAPDLLTRLAAAARERGMDGRMIAVQRYHAALQAGRFDGLPALVAEVEAAKTNANPTIVREWLPWARAVTAALLTPDAGAHTVLTTLMQESFHSLRATRMTVGALRLAGRAQTAEAVVARARVLFPESPWLLQQERELKGEAVAKTAKVPRVEERKEVEVDEADFFRELDRLAAESRWADAADAIRKLRTLRPVPGWLAWREMELLLREVRINQAAGDAPAMILAVRRLLAGDPARADEVVAFAQELRGKGSASDAALLVRAVLDKAPEHPGAAALWKTLRAEPAATR